MTQAEPRIVTAAVIERDGRLLVARRLKGSHMAGCWEFPGGKCEPGEAPEACLARELLEELGVAAVVQDEIYRTTYAYADRRLDLRFFTCVLLSEPRPLLGCPSRQQEDAMVSVLVLAIAASAALEMPIDAPVEDDYRPSLIQALQQAQHVVLAEVVDTHEVEGEAVEEAAITQVLKGAPGVSHVFYRTRACNCETAMAEQTKPGTPVLLLLSAGAEVRERRAFWQALDKLARPGEFFDLFWGPGGRLAADADGLVETWLTLPESLPAQPAAGVRAGVRRVAIDALVAFVQDRLAAPDEPLK
jgi:8-oxo-dGTP diphosphatase